MHLARTASSASSSAVSPEWNALMLEFSHEALSIAN